MDTQASEITLPKKPRPLRERGWFRSVRRVACLLLVAYLILLLAMMWFEESLIFVPSSSPSDDWHPWGLQIEDAWFQTPDGVRIHGWYVAHEHPRAVVLFAHGLDVQLCRSAQRGGAAGLPGDPCGSRQAGRLGPREPQGRRTSRAGPADSPNLSRGLDALIIKTGWAMRLARSAR